MFEIHYITKALCAHTPDTSPSTRTRHQAAVALVLHSGVQEELSALLIQRAEDPRDPWSGQMALPGGWQDPEDVSLEATARRETIEEIGLDLAAVPLLGRLDDVETERLRGLDLSVGAFVFYTPKLPPLLPNHEVAEVVHVPLTHFLQAEFQEPYQFPHDPLGRQFPSVRQGKHIIWGLTYRVFLNLFALLGHKLPHEIQGPHL